MTSRTRVVLIITVIAACVAVLRLYLWVTGDTQENRYTNYAEAREAQHRGWLPVMLPRSASEIHEWHDVGTNVCFGSFRFDPSERPRVIWGLHSGRRRSMLIDRDPSFAGTLPRDPDEPQLASAGFEFYSEQDFDLAINWSVGMAYYWNSRS